MLPKNKNIDWKNNLYNHQPDESVWAKIEENLDFQIRLDRQLRELPVHKPEDKVWERIASNLPNNKISVFRYRIISIAASVAAVMALSTFLLLTNSENRHSTTQISPTSESNMEQEAIAEIRTYCTVHASACEQGNFKELMQLYDELKTEETELKKAMHQLGDSPEMIQAMIKIENLKSETIQDMILMIQS